MLSICARAEMLLLSSLLLPPLLLQLVQLFGQVRDRWIAEDLAGWLAPNKIYPGVAEAVKAALQHDDVYIVTTKQVKPRSTITCGTMGDVEYLGGIWHLAGGMGRHLAGLGWFV